MPKWDPTIHGSSDTILMHTPSAGRRRKRRGPSPAPMNMHTAPHNFAINFGNKRQGLWVREANGSYAYQEWTFDEALKAGYDESDIFVVGRTGYYLTLAEARQAIPDGAHGVSYVDDFNDEWQDYYICAADDIDPEPYKEAHSPEPIQ
jgi:hypothetical protein